jgi:Ca-activated chloride channel family protein
MTITHQIDLIPLRAAVASDRPTTLDVLVRITPPVIEQSADRPTLNLGLVIDRSGSMDGDKIRFARQAAAFAVEQLLPHDRVSVTIFDDQVETVVPSTFAEGKAAILRAIDQIRPGGSTALHEGWRQGGIQVSQHLDPEHLNRVIVLSDGLANVGETNPDTIATDVNGLARHGVSTTTMGVGDDYHEDLMEAMARSGDGNYYYIQSPDQLPTIFQAELRGLMTTVGTRVSLGLTGVGEVLVQDVMNDFDRTPGGRHKLPNLLMGTPIEAVIRLRVPAMSGENELLTVRLAWDDPRQAERQFQLASLRLPAVPGAELDPMEENAEVLRQVAVLMAARARQEAVAAMDRGDREYAQQTLRSASMAMAAAPAAPMMLAEMEALADLSQDLEEGDVKKARKKATFQAYSKRQSR